MRLDPANRSRQATALAVVDLELVTLDQVSQRLCAEPELLRWLTSNSSPSTRYRSVFVPQNSHVMVSNAVMGSNARCILDDPGHTGTRRPSMDVTVALTVALIEHLLGVYPSPRHAHRAGRVSVWATTVRCTPGKGHRTVGLRTSGFQFKPLFVSPAVPMLDPLSLPPWTLRRAEATDAAWHSCLPRLQSSRYSASCLSTSADSLTRFATSCSGNSESTPSRYSASTLHLSGYIRVSQMA